MKKILAIVSLMAFGGCTCQDKVSFDTAEDARRQVRDNVQFNAQEFRIANKEYGNWDIMVRGDSTVSVTCPQGDGWASVDLKYSDGQVVKMKCSTVSAGIGCMTDVDFKTRPYSKEEGSCNLDIPFPLPKIAK